MAPGLLTNTLYNEQFLNRVRKGVKGTDPRLKTGGTKRKPEVFHDPDTTGFLNNNEEDDGQSLGHDLSISSFFPRHNLSVFDTPNSTWKLGCLSNKIIKRAKSMPESWFNDHGLLDAGNIVTIHRSNSTNSLPKLRFRDHVLTYTQRYVAAEAIEDAVSENGTLKDEGKRDGTHLVRLLGSCAEAVACRDKTHATNLLTELRSDALVFGSSFQRVASCLLTSMQPLGAAPARNMNTIALDNKEEALQLVYETCLHIKFSHFIANTTILEAFEGEKNVHVVNIGITLGLQQEHQWRGLIQSMSQTHTPCCLRITAIAVGPFVNQFVIIVNKVEVYALEKGIDFEFYIVESSLETPEDIKT